MRHIKRFNEDTSDTEIKDFFQDKINWKLIHDLEYLLTEYEDKGYYTYYGVSCGMQIYNSVNKYNSSIPRGKELNKYYEHYGIDYIFLIKESEMGKYCLEEQETIYNTLKDKFTLNDVTREKSQYKEFNIIPK